ncbi:MAG: hypothetical protein IT261_13725 [Saprospiraceae bacterium]|nr:hypothetical protein [Saprospiraceae bacterium]
MKQLLTLAFCGLLSGVMWAAQPNKTPANPFQDDLIRLDNEFAAMTQLEQFVEEHNATYSKLAAENHVLLQNVTSDTDISASLLGSTAPDDERLLGIPGFWWGFCLGILGIILVYVALEGDAKKREGKNAIIGFLNLLVMLGVIYLFLFLFGTSSRG